MTQDQQKGQSKQSVVFIFHFLLFTYPLLALLWRRSYQIFSAEVGIMFLLAGVFAVLVTVILSKVRPVIANALTVLLITIIFLVQFNLSLEGIITCLVASLIIAWPLKTRFHLYSLPVLIALISGAWFDSRDSDDRVASASVNSELPPVLHILLDGYIGLDGLPPYSNSRIIKDESYKFFKDFNFQVFPRAYSRHSATTDSLDSAFNFQNDGESKLTLNAMSRSDHALESNAYFDSLATLGYRFNIYQTEYLDLCRSNPDITDKCWGYAQPNLETLRQVESVELRIRMLANVLLKQSYLLYGALDSRGWLFNHKVSMHDPKIFSELKNDFLNEPAGRYFFAHVLLPHPPFTFLHDCSINYKSDNRIRVATIKDEPEQPEHVYENRNNLYFEQMECALASVRNIFNDMQKAGLYEQSIIVIHGDHGSMISKHTARQRHLEHLTSEDYRAIYSILFAIKFPNSEFQVDDRVLPLSSLIEGFSSAVDAYSGDVKPIDVTKLTSPIEPGKVDPYVYLMGTLPLTRVDINIFED